MQKKLYEELRVVGNSLKWFATAMLFIPILLVSGMIGTVSRENIESYNKDISNTKDRIKTRVHRQEIQIK